MVITGLGALTAVGEGAESLWKAALEGRSGVRFLEGFGREKGFGIGAQIEGFDGEKYIAQKKSLKVMARDIQLAVAGASLAIHDAGVGSATVPRERIGVIVGSGILNHELDELASSVKSSIGEDGKLSLKKFGEEGISGLFPLWLLKYLPNMSACHVSIVFDLQGPNNTITTGASASLQAVGEAMRIIQRGWADVMLAGGAESKTNPVGLSQYQILGVLPEDLEADPKTMYRPFDRKARGVVVGEGAGFLVLEEMEHAKKRGAKIYAELLGFGCSSFFGQKVAMKAALHEAGISPKEVGYLQACGLGITEEDLREGEAIEDIFNSAASGLSVAASKPVMGFTGYAAGALDLLVSTLSLKHQTILPTLNLKQPIRDFEFQIVKDKPLPGKITHAMTNAFGLNGQSVSIITKNWVGK